MIQIINSAVVYRGGYSVDADGSPFAYNINDSEGLDYLANAGKPGNWYGVVCNNFGVPIVQGPNDPAPGFYISPTSLVDKTKAYNDPSRYVNSSVIPYIAIAKDLLIGSASLKVGDLAIVSYANRLCGAIVADVGPGHKYGEGSIALAQSLGIPASPKHGGLSKPLVAYAIFRGTAVGWPHTAAEINTWALTLFEAWGGVTKLAEVK